MKGFVSDGEHLVALEGDGVIMGNTITIKFQTEMHIEKLDPLQECEVVSLVLRKEITTL